MLVIFLSWDSSSLSRLTREFMCEKEDNDEANKEKKENIIGFIIQEESGKVRRKLMTASSQIISLVIWKLSRD